MSGGFIRSHLKTPISAAKTGLGMTAKEHSWKVTPTEAIRLQEKIRAAVIERPLNRKIQLVAGVDAGLSSSKDKIVAAVVLLQMNEAWQPKKQKNYGESLRLVEQQHAWADLDFPYIPGLLSFREAPVVLRALKKLKHRPDVVILDGQGQAHPRKAGLASHVGVISELPCIGCAKSRLTGEYSEPGLTKGSWTDLLDKQGEVIGRVVRTRQAVKCVYVSVGHLVSLDEAMRLVLAVAGRYRLPEPTRLAHQLASKLRLHPPGENSAK